MTNILLDVNQTGVTLTANQNFLGLYTSAGAKLAQTADLSTVWTSTGEPTTHALTGAPISVTGGADVFVYVMILTNGSTGVGLRGLPTGALQREMGLVAGTFRNAYDTFSGATALPASFTPGSTAVDNAYYWCGLS